MSSWTVGLKPDPEDATDEVTIVEADTVMKDSDGDLVFQVGQSRIGGTGATEVARFIAGSWRYYYRQDEE